MDVDCVQMLSLIHIYFISQTVYEYDPKGNVISETDKGENKKEETKTVTSYDDHGQDVYKRQIRFCILL